MILCTEAHSFISMFYSSMHQGFDWFLFNCDSLYSTGLEVQLWHSIAAFSYALEISRKKVPGRGKEMGKFIQNRSCQTKKNPEGGKMSEELIRRFLKSYIYDVLVLLSPVRTGSKVRYHLQMRAPKIIYPAPTSVLITHISDLIFIMPVSIFVALKKENMLEG